MHVVCLKDVQAAGVPLTIPFTLAFLYLGLRCLHVQHRLKWNEAYPHQLVAASMRILDSFGQLFLLMVSNIVWPTLPVASRNATET
jgi:hypothetical protein